MQRFRNITPLRLALWALIAYAVGASLIPSSYFIEILNGLFLGLVAAVTIVFFPLFLRAVKAKDFDRVSQLTIGIILTWFSLIVSRSLNTVGRITETSDTIANSPLVAVAAYLAVIGGVLHVTAPGMVDDRLRYNKGLLVAAVTVGLLVAVAAIFLQRRGL